MVIAASTEDALGYSFTLVVLACWPEAQALVEAFGALLAGVVTDRQPMVAPPSGFFAQLFNRKSPVALTLVPGANS